MHPPTLDELATRLDKVERQNRRLKRFSVVFFGLFLLLAGWTSYRNTVDTWRPGMWTQGINLYNGKPFSFGELVGFAAKGSFTLEDDRGFRGNIGSRQKIDHMGRQIDYTGLFFTNEQRNRAFLSVSGRGAFLQLEDSTNAVYLGPGLYDDGRLLLELISQDGRQGIRLGLDGDQQPLFEVIQDGEAASLLSGPARVSSNAQHQTPMRDVSHQ